MYTIYLSDDEPFRVYCAMDKDGWTRILYRNNYNSYFNRIWQDYKKGFGSVEKNYWMGFDNIRKLIGNQRMELRIDMYNVSYQNYYLIFDNFLIDLEENSYALTLGQKIDGNCLDSFSELNSMKFTTIDKDNDLYGNNCAKEFGGGWWFRACYGICLTCYSNIGIYKSNALHNSNQYLYLNYVEMLIKPML